MLRASTKHRVRGLRVVNDEGATVVVIRDTPDDTLIVMDRGTAEYEEMRDMAVSVKTQLEQILDAKVRTEIYAQL